MEEHLHAVVAGLPTWALYGLIAVSLAVLAKNANLVVEKAVLLSTYSGLPKVVIGATVVSIGTTMPEAVVSVLAAINGSADLALGNSVGSIICDTGLILGVACMIAPLPLDRAIVNRQGWMQLGAGVLLVVCTLPFGNIQGLFLDGGRLSRVMGFVFLGLLVLYLWVSIVWARKVKNKQTDEKIPEGASIPSALWMLMLGIAFVVLSSWVLIACVKEAAIRMNVPEGVIAATLVAFGTSLPELVTAITAVRRGHGALAVGNVIGADILNVLFVSGAAAAVTPGGLAAPPYFFKVFFPGMLVILLIFRIGVAVSGERLKRSFGVLLFCVYLVIMYLAATHG